MDPEPVRVEDGLIWWAERKALYPCLLRMVLDYLLIPGEYLVFLLFPLSKSLYPAMSTDVEHIFSQGQIVLSHLRNCLSVASIKALMFVRAWSLLGYVKDSDICAVTVQGDDIEEEDELEEGWDNIL